MKLTKTTALKAALLLVLAANMSWEKIEFGSVQLAQTGTPKSEAVKTGVTDISGGGSTAAPTSKSPEGASVKVTAPPPAAVAVAPAAPAPAKTSPPSHTAPKPLLVCGEKYEIHYEQKEDNLGKPKTEVSATQISDREQGLSFNVSGQMLELAFSDGSLKDINERLNREIKAMRAKKGQSCVGETTSATTAAADPKSEEEKRELADNVKNCKTDTKGVELKSAKYKSCLIRELGRVKKRIDTKDEEGRRLSEREIARNTLTEIQSLYGKIKTEIRRGLFSKKDMDVDDAERLIDEAITAVEIAGEGFSGDEDAPGFDKTVAKMVDELRSLKKGSETRREAQKLKEKGEDVKTSLTTTREQALKDPLNQQAISEYNQAVFDFNQFRQSIGKEFEQDELLSLNQYKRRGVLSQTDYVDFVKPYTELRDLLMRALASPSTVSSTQEFKGPIKGSVLGSEYAPPANLGELRSTRSLEAARNLGVTFSTSVRPTVQPVQTNSATVLQAPRSTFGN